jgi:hypothetical protein
MLDNFKEGWRNKFESCLNYVQTTLPEARIESIERYKAMLRIKFVAPNPDMQYLLDCLSYKIERDSARMCEFCGEFGYRRLDELFTEPLCLCFTCYVREVDSILNNNQ